MRIERGSSDECPYCGLKERNQHTLRQAGKCDGIRSGKLNKDGTPKAPPKAREAA